MTRQFEVEDLMYALHKAGWSIGDVEVEDVDTGLKFWLFTGRNGENPIRARHPNMLLAWWIATEQAKAVGMFGMCDAAHPLFDIEL